jgi:hypothetical protein
MTFKLQLEFKIIFTLYKQHVILHIKIWYFSNFICFIQLINGFSSNPLSQARFERKWFK